tara:strand:- start:212 stop:559 length:348 start_codon:yes stop_codon:yes gene_type:complete
MIALNEIRADLTLAVAWCDLEHTAVRERHAIGHVFLQRTGRTAVRPMIQLSGQSLEEAEEINALARACLEILGYPAVSVATRPSEIRVALVKVGPRSNHDRIAAFQLFSGLGRLV